MSQENVEIVRKALRARKRSRRTLDQRLFLRFPSLAIAVLRLITRLSPRSRIRQAALRRAMELAMEAFNRRDLEAVFIASHPEFEYWPEPAWVEGGLLEPSYRGMDGYRKFVATADEVWGGENYLEPLEIIDMGEQWIVLANGRMRAQVSGVTLSEEYAGVATVKDGQVIRVQEYYDHTRGLEAVGLSERKTQMKLSGPPRPGPEPGPPKPPLPDPVPPSPTPVPGPPGPPEPPRPI